MARPRKTAPPKREAIFEAAWRVFLQHGYERATMDEVAARAGVSKRTVYDHFMSKERLFGAIVRRRRDEMLAGLSGGELDERDPEATLVHFATSHLTMAMSLRVLELYRVVVAEAPRLREPASIMFEAGLDRVLTLLAAYLSKLVKSGVLRAENPRQSAEGFIGLLAGMPTTRALMRVAAPSSSRQIAAQARFAVRVFLDGARRSPSRAPQ